MGGRHVKALADSTVLEIEIILCKMKKNKQLIVFMDVVKFLKPKFVLMENVVDILKFADGFLGRYAMGRLIEMNYQTRIGMLAAGAYGLPQFRMRVFLWGARPTEVSL